MVQYDAETHWAAVFEFCHSIVISMVDTIPRRIPLCTDQLDAREVILIFNYSGVEVSNGGSKNAVVQPAANTYEYANGNAHLPVMAERLTMAQLQIV